MKLYGNGKNRQVIPSPEIINKNPKVRLFYRIVVASRFLRIGLGIVLIILLMRMVI